MKGISQIQRRLYLEMLKKVHSLQGRPSVEMSRYQKAYRAISKKKFKLSSEEELFQAAHSLRPILVGDFHSHDQSLKNFLRLLKHLLNHSNIILGLEMVMAGHQKFIDAYLQGHLTELEFLQSIHYHQSWRFPWGHYREIFDLAKKRGIKIIGLNSNGSLNQRDQFAAQIILQKANEMPRTPLLALFGELHLGSIGLPYFLQEAGLAPLILHQNLEDLFWKLPGHIQNDGGIIRFSKKEYALISSPPWVKLDSMINWYEGLMEDEEYDIHKVIYENGARAIAPSHEEQFEWMCQSALKIIDPNHNVYIQTGNLQIFDCTQMKQWEKQLRVWPKNLQAFFNQLMTSQETFGLPFAPIYYCQNYSFNRLCLLLGHFLFFEARDPWQFFSAWEKGGHELFQYFFCLRSFSFLVSKIFNPHRKCNHVQELIEQRDFNPHTHLSLSLLENPASWNRQLKKLKPQDLWQMAGILGPLFSDLCIPQFKSQNKFATNFLQQIWHQDARLLDWPTWVEHFEKKTPLLIKSKRHF